MDPGRWNMSDNVDSYKFLAHQPLANMQVEGANFGE